MDLLLAVLGLILTVLLSGPTVKAVQRRRRRRRTRLRWSADAQVRGAIAQLSHYGFEFWRQVIEVDSAGNATHSVDARLLNLHDRLISEVTFPVYADTAHVSGSSLSPWATTGRRRLKVDVEDWIPERARGRIRINLKPPVRPGEARRLRWGYHLPATFRPGDEYYNYDVANPFDELTLEFRFDNSWSVLYARWEGHLGSTQQPPKIDGRVVRWTVRFPGVGQRVIMLFGLARTGKLSSCGSAS